MNRHWLIPALMLAILVPSRPAQAVVDMKNSNYTDSWLDLTLAGTGYALKVQRYYNSRSIFSGIFGFGWCSDFETKLEKTPEGRLKLAECGAGQEVIYTAGKFDSKAMDKTVEEIVAYYKKQNPSVPTAKVDTLREQLKNYGDVRNEWAKEAKIKLPDVKKGMVYKAENLEVEQITFDGNYYTRTMADGSSQRFDDDGRLAFMYDKNGNYLKLSWNTDSLRDITDNSGRKLNFAFNQNKRVREITGPNSIKVEYKYKGEDLTGVTNMWANAYTYDYDETHNLTRIGFPDKTFKALTYNQKNDWVTSFTDRALNNVTCTEAYKYEVDKADPKNHYWSVATKKCGNEIKNDARFEFWYKNRPDGTKFLSRVLTRSLTDSLDVTYHPEFGRPLTVKKNNVTTSFDYYANGLIREKSTSATRLMFEYKNGFNKVSKVQTEFFDTKTGKVVRKRDTNFEYDGKANLIYAKNTDGQFVKLAYDTKGRISTIEDQAKKIVQIKFDERTGKPASITRPKVGTINVLYKSNGDINKVESSDGPTVAVQIASTFNNLLDIISPATSELNL